LLITFLGASAFWINHYFQRPPNYLIALNAYSLAFLVTCCLVCVSAWPGSVLGKIGATLAAAVFTAAFIGFEWVARRGVQRSAYEFWFMATS
jgi:hypothetical protein